tara:strand:- start:27 stop:317 length:291 start_codon:yes stop_codon:yes gene_type:complete
MKKEDYKIIAPDNKVWDFQEWMKNPNMINDVSENQHPVMYVEGKPVYEGDKLIFNGNDNGKSYQTLREVKWQHRALINGNKDWINNWSFSVTIYAK